MSNSKSTIILYIALIILLAISVFLGVICAIQKSKINELRLVVENREINSKIVNFLELFIQKVLKAKGEISFNDRLQLESEVRSINDPEILFQWESLVNSNNLEDAQDQVKNLLHLLTRKINR